MGRCEVWDMLENGEREKGWIGCIYIQYTDAPSNGKFIMPSPAVPPPYYILTLTCPRTPVVVGGLISFLNCSL